VCPPASADAESSAFQLKSRAVRAETGRTPGASRLLTARATDHHHEAVFETVQRRYRCLLESALRSGSRASRLFSCREKRITPRP
jgi:hypothetical protein